MVNEDSPVKDFYPVNFETDLNGKQQEWEAVVLIPFIQEDRLLEAMGPCFTHLTDEVLLHTCQKLVGNQNCPYLEA